MRIISVDPGFERMGVAVVEQTGSGRKPLVLYSTCIKTNPKDAFSARLKIIGGAIEETIKKYRPAALAIEKLFFSTNQRTALSVSEARGVVVYEAAKRGLSVFEYTPIQIKAAVAGYGHATKNQVVLMVKALTDFKDKEKKTATRKTSDDEFDAIAVGLTHLACSHAPRA